MKSIKYHLTCWILVSFGSIIQAQVLQTVTDLGVYSKIAIQFLGLTTPEYDVQMYKVTYNTTDNSGNNVIASGMIAVPINPDCDRLPIALYGHGTIVLREDVPSRDNPESTLGKALATRGYVTVMPDYLGLGDSPGLHPFQHAESEARVSLDIIRAAKEFIEDSLTYTYNHQVFLTGYSQGGHTAMATLKAIKDANLQNEFNVIASAPLSGSYHSSATQARVILNDLPYGNQGFVIYMIMAYQEIYGGIYNTPSDFLQSPYDVDIPPLFDGNTSLVDINDDLTLQASGYLNPTFLANFLADSSTKTSALWQAIMANDNYDWKPDGHVKLFYCGGDQTVFPENTTDAYVAMTANGAGLVLKEDLGNLSHGGCIVPSISGAIDYFENLRPACDEPASITKINENSVQFQLFPNPSRDFIEIKNNYLNTNLNLTIYSATGTIVYRSSTQSSLTIDVAQWAEGIYLVQLGNAHNFAIKKLIIQH